MSNERMRGEVYFVGEYYNFLGLISGYLFNTVRNFIYQMCPLRPGRAQTKRKELFDAAILLTSGSFIQVEFERYLAEI